MAGDFSGSWQDAKGVKKEILDRVSRRMNLPFCPTVLEIKNILIHPADPGDPYGDVFLELEKQSIAPVVGQRTLQGSVFRTLVSNTGNISTKNSRGVKIPGFEKLQRHISLTREDMLLRPNDTGVEPEPDNFVSAFGYNEVIDDIGGEKTQRFSAQISGDFFRIATRDEYPQQTYRNPEDIQLDNDSVEIKDISRGVYDDPVVQARQDDLIFFRATDPHQAINKRLRDILLGDDSPLNATSSISVLQESLETNNSILFFENLITTDPELLQEIKDLPQAIRESLARLILQTKTDPGDIRLLFEV